MKKFLLIPLVFLALQAVSQSDAPKGLKVGDTAPSFITTDFTGNKLVLSELLQKGKVIILFYRGAWCPYCNRYMSELQKNAEKFTEKGVTVIAVTPETNEFVAEMIDKTKTSFSVVYDKDRSLMTKFDVLYKMDVAMQEKFKGYKIDIDQRNGSDDHVLPVPATYIIGKDGKIDFVHFDPNFKVRANIEDILANLK